MTPELAYQRFPIRPLTEEWARTLGHIDYFTSDNIDYALDRMGARLQDFTSGINVSVWVLGERLIAEANIPMLAPPYTPAELKTVYEEPKGYGPADCCRDDLMAAGIESGFAGRVSLWAQRFRQSAQARSKDSVEYRMGMIPALPHFATIEKKPGTFFADEEDYMPHFDDGDANNVRLVQTIYGPRTLILPNDSWMGVEDGTQMFLGWKRPRAKIVAPMYEVPAHSVVAITANEHPNAVFHHVAVQPFECLDQPALARLVMACDITF